MFKAIAIMALGTVLALPPVVAVAQTGYGTSPIPTHIRPSSAPGTRATRARIARAGARNGCAIITATRSKGHLKRAEICSRIARGSMASSTLRPAARRS
jgi:hypothetical protein